MINGHFVEAIMYADDLIVISATVNGLQTLLASCESSCDELLLDFNCKKCSCIAIGPAHKYNISDMTLCNDKIVWSNKFKYLGVNFIAGKKLSIDVNLIKRSFYV